jgi:hypothetical protein
LHFNVTGHPTAAWTAQQLAAACGIDEKPKYLLRDRDAIYGNRFSQRAHTLGIKEVLTCVWRIPILSHKTMQNRSLVMPVAIVTMAAQCAI